MIDDERDFWAHEPTRSLPRIGRSERRPAMQRGRRHAASTPADAAVVSPDSPRRTARTSDPLLRRLGVMVVAVVATIPIATTLRDGGAESVVRGAAPAAEGTAALGASSSSETVIAPSAVPAADSTAAAPSTATATAAETLAPATVAPTEAPATAAATAPATAAATVAPTAAPVTTSAARVERAIAATPTCTTGYDVVAGDYWILIADKIDVSTSELFAANGAGPDTALYPGRTICVPAGASATTTTDAPSTTQAPSTSQAPATTAAPKAPTTTAAPKSTTTTETPATTVPQRSYSASEVEAIIREVWPDDLEEEALRIARRESNLQPTAKNFCCYGLFQLYWNVHKGWLTQLGITSSAGLFDPRANANAALTLYYRSGGWGPWAVG